MDRIEQAIKDLLEKVQSISDEDIAKCRNCYLKQNYGSREDTFLTVRKLIMHLLQENLNNRVAISIGDKTVPLLEEDYLSHGGDSVILVGI